MRENNQHCIGRELFVESLFVNHAEKITTVNKKNGIAINDSIGKRCLGLIFVLASQDFLSSLKSIQVIKSAFPEGMHLEKSVFIEKWCSFISHFSKRLVAERKAVLLAWLIDLYSLDINDSEARWLIDQSCQSLEEKRALYAGLRVVCERPQFLFERKAIKTDFTLLSCTRDMLDEEIGKACILEDKGDGKENYNNILFIFGHAQPLPYTGSHWRQVVTYVTGFCDAYPNKNVKLIVTNESTTSSFPYNLHALPSKWDERLLSQAEEVYEGELPANLDISLFSPIHDNSLVSNVSKEISGFSPDIAFGWLGFFSADLFFGLVSKFCNIYSIQFQAGNKPNKFSKYIFSQGDTNNQSSAHLEEGYVYLNNPIPLVPEKNKGEWKVPPVDQSNFNVVTTLGNGRLERAFNSYSDVFLARFFKLFDEHKSLSWVFVGAQRENITNYGEELDTLIDSGRVTFYKRVDDLRSFYSYFSAYVHMPKLHGGGWGIGLAAFEGIPILSQSGGDADNFLPKSCLFNSEEVFFEKFQILLTSRDKRQELCYEQGVKLKDHTPLNVAKSLYLKALDCEKKSWDS
jgi:hypothetical protein